MRFTTDTQHDWWKDLFLLCLLLSSMFVFMLGSRPLNVPDEARYCEIPREMLVTHDFITPRINGIKYFEKPPLFYWIQAGDLHWFGLSEWSCRAADAFLALLGCLATYITARKLFNRRTGWLASLILASSLLYFALARVVTLDMSVSIFLTLTLYAILLGLQRPPDKQRRLLFYLAYTCAALAVLTKGLIGIIFPGSIIFLWLLFTGRWQELKHCYLFTGLLLFLIIATPWHLLVQQAHPEFFHYYFIRQQFSRYLTNVAGRYQPDWFYLLVLLGGLFPWTGFLYGVIRTWPRRDPVSLFLGIWTLFVLLFFSLSHSKLVPYILPCFPPLAILIARYMEQTIRQHGQTCNKAGWIGWCSMVVLSISLAIAIPLWLQPAVTTDYAAARISTDIVIGLLIFTVLIVPWIYYQHGLLKAVIAQFICSIGFLWGVSATLPYLYFDSVKSMALYLKPLLKPGDMVASYDYYYQDLPFYLQRTVSIINWKGELEFGANHQKNLGDFMLNQHTFEQHWQSKQQVYAILPKDLWQHDKEAFHNHFYVLYTLPKDILITNHRMNVS